MSEILNFKVSVITVCRNCLEGLKRTYGSLQDQWDSEIEWLVIDGASEDGTKEWLTDCHYDKLRFVSEPDKGIFDAMNKGVRISRGNWILFMNAGDTFSDKFVLRKLIANLEDSPDIVAGHTVFLSNYGTRLCHAKPLETVREGMPFCHQSVIVKREWLLRHPFVTRYHLTADYEFFYWAADQRPVYKIVDFPIALFDGRDSVSERNWIEVKRQYRQIQGRYDGFMNRLSWTVFVGVHWIKGMIKRFIPEAVLRRRKERYYTTDC